MTHKNNKSANKKTDNNFKTMITNSSDSNCFKKVNNNINEINKNLNDDEIYKKIFNRISNSEKGYNKRNDKKLNNEDMNDPIMCLVGYYKVLHNDDMYNKIKYNEHFKFKMDIKLKNIKQLIADKLIKDIEKIDNQWFMIDTQLKTINKNTKPDDLCDIYYLKVYTKFSLKDLFTKSIHINLSNQLGKIMNPHFENIIQNKDNNNIIIRELDRLTSIIKYRIMYTKETKEEWLKSNGEFLTLIILFLKFNKNVLVNSKFIENPQSNRKLEFDFYLCDEHLVIEVDGKQHNDKDQKCRDLIKDIICESNNIQLLREKWNNNNKNYVESLLSKIDIFINKFNTDNLNKIIVKSDFNNEQILNICDTFSNNTFKSKFDYTIKESYNYSMNDDEFHKKITDPKYKNMLINIIQIEDAKCDVIECITTIQNSK
jgi:very-short-patch-repair endonuclease